MRKTLLLISVLFIALITNATGPTITIDGDKSDWAEVPMLSQPGTWPMLKVLSASDAEMGTNELAFMLENNSEFTTDWSKYPGTYLDKDYSLETNPYNSNWIYTGMGIDYAFTIGASSSTGWIDFPIGKSADYKAIELGVPSSYLSDLGSKFGIGMYYGTGGTQEWFIPQLSGNEISPSIGYFYKSRSYTTVDGTTTLTTDNVFAHQCIGEVGAYVDFGLRDNGNDTARWAAFPINLTAPAMYDVTANVAPVGTSWNFEFWLVDVATNAIVAHIDKKESNVSENHDSYTFGTLDLLAVPAGKYMLKVKNRTPYSKVRLNSIDLTYAGGNRVAIPANTLEIEDAWFSSGCKRQDGVIKFPSTSTEVPNAWNKWNISVANEAFYDVTITIKNKYEHNLTAAIYSADGNTLIDQASEGGNKGTYDENGHSFRLGGVYLTPGNYILKLTNAREGSDAKIVRLSFAAAGGETQTMPTTTNIDQAWYSDNGTRTAGEKIDFPNGDIQNGWVKWNVAFASAGNYQVEVYVNSNSCKNYTVALCDENDADQVTPLTLNDCSTKGSNVKLEMGSMNVPAGNYILKVTNSTVNSDAELLSVKFIRAGGGLINLPTTKTPLALTFDEIILSSRAWIDNDSILFTERGKENYNSENWAKWNVHSTGGLYQFTANGFNASDPTAENPNGQKYKVTVLVKNTAETDTMTTKTSSWASPGASSCTTDIIELPAGDYVVKVENPLYGSKGRVLSVVANYLGGATVELPNADIPLAAALLSTNAYRNAAETELHFIAPEQVSHIASEWAKWNIHVATEGTYAFTLDVVGTNHGVYTLTLDNGISVSQGKGGAGSVTLPTIFLAQGDHVIQLANTNNYADGYLTGVSCATVDGVVVMDENDENMDVITSNTGTHVPAIKRTFRTGVYNSICVPFNISSNELTKIFGEGYELIELNSATLEGSVLTLNFVTPEENKIQYGRPYLITPTKDVVNPVFEAHSISSSTSHLVVEKSVVNFVGVLYKQNLGTHPENLYLGADGKLYFSNNDVTIQGFRAYFHVNVSNPQQVIKHARIVTGGQVATYIDVVGNDNTNGVLKTIENGQLIIIRDAVRYNVCGQRLE